MSKYVRLIIIVLIYVLLSKSVWGQYVKDEVEQAYVKRYYADGIVYATMPYPVNGAVDTVKELFMGNFRKTKVLLALSYQKECCDGQSVVPALDAVNNRTGERHIFKDTIAFFRFINSAHGEISNLDKSYLYLFLFVRILRSAQMAISQPWLYNPSIGGSSIFAGPDGNKVFLENYCNECAVTYYYYYHPKRQDGEENVARIKNDIEHSTPNKIVIYTFDEIAFSHKGSENHPTAYRYQFTFNKNNLENVETTAFTLNLQ